MRTWNVEERALVYARAVAKALELEDDVTQALANAMRLQEDLLARYPEHEPDSLVDILSTQLHMAIERRDKGMIILFGAALAEQLKLPEQDAITWQVHVDLQAARYAESGKARLN